jgi:hypothetical protein
MSPTLKAYTIIDQKALFNYLRHGSTLAKNVLLFEKNVNN